MCASCNYIAQFISLRHSHGRNVTCDQMFYLISLAHKLILADDENLEVFTTRDFVSFLTFTDISRREIDHYFFKA